MVRQQFTDQVLRYHNQVRTKFVQSVAHGLHINLGRDNGFAACFERY